MARKQTRKTFSVSRATYDAATAAAAREGIATSEWVTRLIGAACPDLPKQLHKSTPEDRSATAALTRGVPRERRAPVQLPSRAELDRMATERKLAQKVTPGAYCANCIDAKATHRGVIDNTGVIYDLCDACELPAREARGAQRGYEPNGGLPTAKEATEGARRVLGDERYEAEAEREKQLGLAPSPRNTNEMDDFVAESIRRQRTRAWSANGRRR